MKCPGQDTQYWTAGAIFEVKCPECKGAVEFFKDDTTRKCGHCGHRFVNPKMDFGCAAYCQYAEQCLGTLPPELMAEKEDLLKDRVAIEMKRYFHTDFKRIGHATRVARYAERIGKAEGGNMAVILVAAYLHDIGLKTAEKKHGAHASEHHEAEGVTPAQAILEKLSAQPPLIEAVCGIIARHHRPPENPSTEFQAVFDADLIVNMEDAEKERTLSSEKKEQTIRDGFFTRSGSALAAEIFLPDTD